MTSASPRELLTAHRATRREAAMNAARPLIRGHLPGLTRTPGAVIYLHAGKLRLHPVAGRSQLLTATRLLERLPIEAADAPAPEDGKKRVRPDAGDSIVLADRGTRAALLRWADDLGDDPDSVMLRRIVQVLGGLNASQLMPVLTQALEHRFWLPEGLNPHSLADWAEAFDVPTHTPGPLMTALIAHARTAGSPLDPDSLSAKDLTALTNTELDLIRVCRYGGMNADLQRYAMTEGHTARFARVRAMDPGLLDENLITGVLSELTVTGYTDGVTIGTVSSPFKFRPGKGVKITDLVSEVGMTLDEVTIEGDDRVVALGQVTGRTKAHALIAAARVANWRLFVMEPLFDLRTRKLDRRRWLGGDVERVRGRVVPMDVLVAGSPSD
ncbi:hypothetical protein V6N00_13540 [Tersicoccus sp. MR15.9]|uniref:hypothetical protein n=1 Tax=Tersicoccus mangrovi TaxID=3121635 RepID=UPI002FE678EC